jgi:hypothetical protein
LLVDLETITTDSYQVSLIAGRYDVLYSEPSTTCGTTYPCQRAAVLRKAAELNASGVLDIDIKTAAISGRITLDGVAPPTAVTPPIIELRGTDESTGMLVDLADAVGGSYQARVIAGSYDVLYTTRTCTASSPWPCQFKRAIKSGLQLATSGVLDLPLRTFAIAGKVTLDHAAPPAGTQQRITLRGADKSTGTLVELAMSPSGAYATRLLEGTYDLFYSDNTVCAASPWPCNNDAPLRDGVMIAGDGALDVDVPTILVAGRVTFAGQPPATMLDAPRIALRGVRETRGTLVDLARATAGAYQTRIVPGQYVVLYQATGTCDGGQFPCQFARAVKGCGSTP